MDALGFYFFIFLFFLAAGRMLFSSLLVLGAYCEGSLGLGSFQGLGFPNPQGPQYEAACYLRPAGYLTLPASFTF